MSFLTSQKAFLAEKVEQPRTCDPHDIIVKRRSLTIETFTDFDTEGIVFLYFFGCLGIVQQVVCLPWPKLNLYM